MGQRGRLTWPGCVVKHTCVPCGALTGGPYTVTSSCLHVPECGAALATTAWQHGRHPWTLSCPNHVRLCCPCFLSLATLVRLQVLEEWAPFPSPTGRLFGTIRSGSTFMVSSVYGLLAGLVNMPAQIWGALFATMHLSCATASSWLPPVNSTSTSHTVSLFSFFLFFFWKLLTYMRA